MWQRPTDGSSALLDFFSSLLGAVIKKIVYAKRQICVPSMETYTRPRITAEINKQFVVVTYSIVLQDSGFLRPPINDKFFRKQLSEIPNVGIAFEFHFLKILNFQAKIRRNTALSEPLRGPLFHRFVRCPTEFRETPSQSNNYLLGAGRSLLGGIVIGNTAD